MIIQRSPNDESAIAISQVAHSWMSGQLDREWGNAEFGTFQPREPLCYAAELHDIGFFPWEQRPRWNPRTGFPFTFEDLPIAEHVEIWRRSICQLQAVSAYAALMTSFHFSGLCERRSHKGVDSGARIAEDFLQEQRRYQAKLLAASPRIGPPVPAARRKRFHITASLLQRGTCSPCSFPETLPRHLRSKECRGRAGMRAARFP